MVSHFFRDGLGEKRRKIRHTLRIGLSPQFAQPQVVQKKHCAEQTSPIPPPPLANSFVIGTAVINTHIPPINTHPQILESKPINPKPLSNPNKLLNITSHDRSSIVICGWDPGKDDDEGSLSDCGTVLACDDGGTFADDFAVAGGISGNGVQTTTGMTSTTARDFAEQGPEHDNDSASDDDGDPD
jgi:hypothetical protein